jgi:hypothetical protein
LKAVGNEPDNEALNAQHQAELRRLKSANQDQAAEIKRLQAALSSYEASDNNERGIRDSKIALKARLSALQALSDEQSSTIQALRAEVASGNERLARQAAYFMEEMRRLGSGTVPTSAPGRRPAAEPAKRPLVERINDPRVARLVRAGAGGDEAQKSNPRRVSGFLKALDGESSAKQGDAQMDGKAETQRAVKDAAAAPEAAKAPAATDAEGTPARKPRLLERITGLDKTSA